MHAPLARSAILARPGKRRAGARSTVAALAVLAGLAGTAPATAATKGPVGPVEGSVAISVHTHSAGDLLFPTHRLPYDFGPGTTFAYSSRRCGGPAPFNDLGLDFDPNYPGVDDDADGRAPVRHYVQGTVTQVFGDHGIIEGTITTVLCVRGKDGVQTESPHVIVSHFRARYMRVSDNEIKLYGRFKLSPTESTGTFAGIQGGGLIEASLVCLGHQRNPSTAPTCRTLGHFTDFVGTRGDQSLPPGEIQPGLVGSFSDPTVTPVRSA